MKKKTDWPAVLEAFEGCGLTHAQFCSKHNVSLPSFQQRLYRWRKESRASGGFAQISVEVPARADFWAELSFSGDFSLQFKGPVDAAYLAELLTLLRP